MVITFYKMMLLLTSKVYRLVLIMLLLQMLMVVQTLNGIVLTQPDEIIPDFTSNYLVAQPHHLSLDFQDLSEPTIVNATSAPSAVVTSWLVNGVDEVFGPGNFDNTQSFTFYTMGDHEVTIVATNNNGICSEEYSEYFTAQGLSENNVFSPNGDNINDLSLLRITVC